MADVLRSVPRREKRRESGLRALCSMTSNGWPSLRAEEGGAGCQHVCQKRRKALSAGRHARRCFGECDAHLLLNRPQRVHRHETKASQAVAARCEEARGGQESTSHFSAHASAPAAQVGRSSVPPCQATPARRGSCCRCPVGHTPCSLYELLGEQAAPLLLAEQEAHHARSATFRRGWSAATGARHSLRSLCSLGRPHPRAASEAETMARAGTTGEARAQQ